MKVYAALIMAACLILLAGIGLATMLYIISPIWGVPAIIVLTLMGYISASHIGED